MAKEKIMKQAEENLNEKTDISTPLSEFVRKFKKQKTAIVALVFILFLVVLSFTAKFIAPYGINDFDYNAIMQAPTAAHWFGTDEFGRDLFSRIICGTGISLSVGLFSVSIAAVIGSFLGLIGGYYGGIIDSIIMRICDALFAFPGIILAIAIVAILGSGMTNVVIAVAVFNIPKFARLVRGNTLATKNSVFVQAAKNIGADDKTYSVLPHPAERDPGHHRAVQYVHRIFDSDCVFLKLLRHGRPASDTGVGTAFEQRTYIHDEQLAYHPVPGPCDLLNRTQLQSAGRRPQRRA